MIQTYIIIQNQYGKIFSVLRIGENLTSMTSITERIFGLLNLSYLNKDIDTINFEKLFKILLQTLRVDCKYNVCLKILLQQVISEPVFYGDLVYKFKRIISFYSVRVCKYKRYLKSK